MLHRNNVVDKCNARFQQIFGDYNINANGKIIVSHFGEFSQDLVNSLSTGIEDTMLESGDKKGVVKRMFSILVEGLQNIRIHGERDEDNNQISFLIVLQTEDEYKVTFGNLVKSENTYKIIERIDTLNQMDTDQVKELYMEVLSNGIISNKGGAGLGFITMALKAKSKINYESQEVSDTLTFFSVNLVLERSKKGED
ncbi:MAG: SiaB family protein kinase [Crocinitomicaceae bacterium]|nr:SiaB family protein kinase [Crocinitomicaceae bacterium]